jgi:hypothetical protein
MNNIYVIVILCILAIMNYINVNYDYFADTKTTKTCCPDTPKGWEVIENQCYLNCIDGNDKKCGSVKGKEQYKIESKDKKKCCVQMGNPKPCPI